MNIHPVNTKQEHKRALRRIEELMSAEAGSEAGEELDVLATLVSAYEEANFPVDAADPVAAILFRMEQQGLERKDLEPFVGSRHRVSEILNRKRSLSLAMIRKLHKGLGIPLAVLIGEAA